MRERLGRWPLGLSRWFRRSNVRRWGKRCRDGRPGRSNLLCRWRRRLGKIRRVQMRLGNDRTRYSHRRNGMRGRPSQGNRSHRQFRLCEGFLHALVRLLIKQPLRHQITEQFAGSAAPIHLGISEPAMPAGIFFDHRATPGTAHLGLARVTSKESSQKRPYAVPHERYNDQDQRDNEKYLQAFPPLRTSQHICRAETTRSRALQYLLMRQRRCKWRGGRE